MAVLFALSTFFAFTQSPRPNPLQPSAAFPSLDWWKHPIERNAMWRLDRVTTDMRGVFALLDGRPAWAVGRNGTILATADGGASWASGPSNLSLGGVFLALGVRYPMVLARKTRPRGRFRPLPQDAVTDFVDFLSS